MTSLRRRGQTLVFLLVFMAIAITVTTATVAMIIGSSYGASAQEQGTTAFSLAESGAENALLRLLRDPNYAGETLTIGTDQVTITVSGSSQKVITSVGTSRHFVRTVRVVTNLTNGVLSTQSWQEVF